MNHAIARDNGGRRSGVDRRQFLYSDYSPERRTRKDRRSGFDRRRERYKNRRDSERRGIL